MTNLVWPDKIPLPTVDGYQISPSEGVIRTDMESGAARARRAVRRRSGRAVALLITVPTRDRDEGHERCHRR